LSRRRRNRQPEIFLRFVFREGQASGTLPNEKLQQRLRVVGDSQQRLDLARRPTMTEVEWLTCDDPATVLAFLQDRIGERKLRLFAAACCRRIEMLLVGDESRAAVELCETFADHDVPEELRLLASWNSRGPVVEFAARSEPVLRDAALAARGALRVPSCPARS
jgi:hypothetical protein